MFYDEHCKKRIQKDVFNELVKLSKSEKYSAIMELDHLGYDRKSIEETLVYFDQLVLFAEVRSKNGAVPVIFAMPQSPLQIRNSFDTAPSALTEACYSHTSLSG